MRYRTGLLWTSAAVALAGCQASGAAAQDAASASPVGPQTPTAGIQDIVVTARKSAENVQSVPIAISTVSPTTIKDLTMRDIMDVQRVTPGLYINSKTGGGRAKIVIRGQGEADSRLTTDPSVGLYVDGVNYARSYGSRSSLVDIAQIAVLKGPQGTLFGKNTTGGAVVITTQQPNYDGVHGYADVLYGNYNNLQVTGALNLPIVADKMALRVVGQRISRDGTGHDLAGRPLNDDGLWFARGHLRMDPSDNVNILLSGDYARQRAAGGAIILSSDQMLRNANTATGGLGSIAKQLGLNPASAADRLTAYNAWRQYYNDYASGKKFYDTNTDSPFIDDYTHYGFSGTIGVDFGDVSAKSITAYRHFYRLSPSDSDGTPFNTQHSTSATLQRNFSQEIQLTSIDGQGLDWQVGGFYNRETGNEFLNTESNSFVNTARASIQDVDVRNTSTAGYAQIVYNFDIPIRFTGGLRYTHDTRFIDSHNRIDPSLATGVPVTRAGSCNLLSPAAGGPVFPNCTREASVSFNKLTYLASVDYRPNRRTMLYASVSRGYRSGGFSASAASTTYATATAEAAAFTPFEPETVDNYEIGVKFESPDRLVRINAASFYQKYDNVQQQIRDLVNGQNINLIRNAAKATLYGGEVEITVLPTPRIELRTGVGYVHAKYASFLARDSAGNVLDLTARPFPIPDLTFNLSGTYTVPVKSGELKLNLNYSFLGDVAFAPDTPTLSATTQPGYGLLGGRVSWMIDDLGLDVALFVNNMTNKRYYIAATNVEALGFNYVVPGTPRLYGLQVRKTF